MPISESKNRANRAWDRDNMRTVSCRVRTEDAIEFSEYCKENKISPCYLWPDGESAEKIYIEAGFRNFVTKLAGRAKYMQ